jgi:hypothetical protein
MHGVWMVYGGGGVGSRVGRWMGEYIGLAHFCGVNTPLADVKLPA